MMSRIKKLQGATATFVSGAACGFNTHGGCFYPLLYTAPEHSTPFTFNPALNNISRDDVADKKLFVPLPDKSLTAWQ